MLVEEIVARRPDLRLLCARDGNSGVERARTALPDVILMDIGLPGIGGFQVLKILAEDPATAHIPVLAISANAMPGDIGKGLEAGFFRYLTKPFKVDEFMDSLDATLDFSRMNGSAAKIKIEAWPYQDFRNGPDDGAHSSWTLASPWRRRSISTDSS